MHLITNGRYRALENTIVGRPLRAMFVQKVRELGVLQFLSVRVEEVTDLVHVQGDPMFPWLVAVVCVLHTKADGYVETALGRVSLTTTS